MESRLESSLHLEGPTIMGLLWIPHFFRNDIFRSRFPAHVAIRGVGVRRFVVEEMVIAFRQLGGLFGG